MIENNQISTTNQTASVNPNKSPLISLDKLQIIYNHGVNSPYSIVEIFSGQESNQIELSKIFIGICAMKTDASPRIASFENFIKVYGNEGVIHILLFMLSLGQEVNKPEQKPLWQLIVKYISKLPQQSLIEIGKAAMDSLCPDQDHPLLKVLNLSLGSAMTFDEMFPSQKLEIQKYALNFLDVVFPNSRENDLKPQLFPYLWRLLRQVFVDTPILALTNSFCMQDLDICYMGRMDSAQLVFKPDHKHPFKDEGMKSRRNEFDAGIGVTMLLYFEKPDGTILNPHFKPNPEPFQVASYNLNIKPAIMHKFTNYLQYQLKHLQTLGILFLDSTLTEIYNQKNVAIVILEVNQYAVPLITTILHTYMVNENDQICLEIFTFNNGKGYYAENVSDSKPMAPFVRYVNLIQEQLKKNELRNQLQPISIEPFTGEIDLKSDPHIQMLSKIASFNVIVVLSNEAAQVDNERLKMLKETCQMAYTSQADGVSREYKEIYELLLQKQGTENQEPKQKETAEIEEVKVSYSQESDDLMQEIKNNSKNPNQGTDVVMTSPTTVKEQAHMLSKVETPDFMGPQENKLFAKAKIGGSIFSQFQDNPIAPTGGTKAPTHKNAFQTGANETKSGTSLGEFYVDDKASNSEKISQWCKVSNKAKSSKLLQQLQQSHKNKQGSGGASGNQGPITKGNNGGR